MIFIQDLLLNLATCHTSLPKLFYFFATGWPSIFNAFPIHLQPLHYFKMTTTSFTSRKRFRRVIIPYLYTKKQFPNLIVKLHSDINFLI